MLTQNKNKNNINKVLQKERKKMNEILSESFEELICEWEDFRLTNFSKTAHRKRINCMKTIFIDGKCMVCARSTTWFHVHFASFFFRFCLFVVVMLWCVCILLRYFLIENYIDLQNYKSFLEKEKITRT